jgi:PIN domain nuclease of toxin-antitoxin system
MNVLLDTQLYLWYLAESKALTKERRKAIGKANQVYVSAVSLWEAVIKIGLGRLHADPQGLKDGIAGSGFLELPMQTVHTITLAQLPLHHRDPFDRMLVAQAMTEGLELLTTDAQLSTYSHFVRHI